MRAPKKLTGIELLYSYFACVFTLCAHSLRNILRFRIILVAAVVAVSPCKRARINGERECSSLGEGSISVIYTNAYGAAMELHTRGYRVMTP